MRGIGPAIQMVCLDQDRRGRWSQRRSPTSQHGSRGAYPDTLEERILDLAVDKALDRLRAGQMKHLDRRTQIERELSLSAGKMERLLDALAEGTTPKDEVIA